MSELKRTPLYGKHLAAGAKIVPFAGWEMPVSYSGILDEHNTVRENLGIFDVSHMGRFRLTGPHSAEALDYLTTGRASALEDGQFIYTMILNERGGVLDDLLVGRHGGVFLVVVNAANLEPDFAHIDAWCRRLGGADLADESGEVALLALQGPQSRAALKKLTGEDSGFDRLAYYRMAVFEILGEEMVVSRTGYTGELGYEIFVSSRKAPRLWDELVALGAKPCGLGARDTLRLEMGYPLYGHELNQEHTPLEANFSWVVDFDKKDFIGKQALLARREAGVKVRLRGITASRRDIPRQGYRLLRNGKEVATVASGSIAPSLGIGIGTAYLPVELATPGEKLELELRGRTAEVEVVKLPFYRRGTAKD